MLHRCTHMLPKLHHVKKTRVLTVNLVTPTKQKLKILLTSETKHIYRYSHARNHAFYTRPGRCT